ncbi:MAG: AraC family transcriptional regulator [Lachnospiraceae bacterium]|nr:AraC family transcriptional regulator [Lachnospiraceae bacterium]
MDGLRSYFLNVSTGAYGELVWKLRQEAENKGCCVYLSAQHTVPREVAIAYGEAQELLKAGTEKEEDFVFVYEDYEKNKRGSQLKEGLLDYIREHYADPGLNVESICEALGKSVSGVSKILKQQGSESVLYYINGVRVEEARRLLHDNQGNISVNEVMTRVGYENPNTFIRVFKRYEGMTPGEFCKMCKNDSEEK